MAITGERLRRAAKAVTKKAGKTAVRAERRLAGTMAVAGDRLRKATKAATKRAGKAVQKAERQLTRKVRGQGRRATLRYGGETALLAGAAALASAAVGEAERIARRRIAAVRRKKPLGFEVRLALDVERADARLTDVLRSEGFGVLTRIDVQATLREKIGAEFRPYLILGACNPQLALRALSADAEAGLMLPCNATVEQAPEGGSVVRIADPAMMLRVGSMRYDPVLREVAAEARHRLQRVAEVLKAHGEAVVL
ncbi:MAG TPA: DUF302 domain-containing protein [Gemmatimonadales bacterium]|jgi:uncharacterized protein (DUF302 family)